MKVILRLCMPWGTDHPYFNPGTRSKCRGSNPGGGKIFRTRPQWPYGPPSLLYEYRVFSGGKAAEAWRWPPTPSCVEVKERVELYLYSSSGSSWPVIGLTFSLPLLDRGNLSASSLPGRLNPLEVQGGIHICGLLGTRKGLNNLVNKKKYSLRSGFETWFLSSSNCIWTNLKCYRMSELAWLINFFLVCFILRCSQYHNM
jgi:hypothetical protein